MTGSWEQLIQDLDGGSGLTQDWARKVSDYISMADATRWPGLVDDVIGALGNRAVEVSEGTLMIYRDMVLNHHPSSYIRLVELATGNDTAEGLYRLGHIFSGSSLVRNYPHTLPQVLTYAQNLGEIAQHVILDNTLTAVVADALRAPDRPGLLDTVLETMPVENITCHVEGYSRLPLSCKVIEVANSMRNFGVAMGGEGRSRHSISSVLKKVKDAGGMSESAFDLTVCGRMVRFSNLLHFASLSGYGLDPVPGGGSQVWDDLILATMDVGVAWEKVLKSRPQVTATARKVILSHPSAKRAALMDLARSLKADARETGIEEQRREI